MSRDERPLEADLTGSRVPAALVSGELELLGLLPNSSNYTFLARATAGDEQVLAVYKPRRGEMPLWDFPEGTLCQREVAAYVVARELGWPNVPPTVLREGPEGVGSTQLFIEFDASQHYFTLEGTHADAFRKVALFDVVVNNADRKGGHCLLGTGRHDLGDRPRRVLQRRPEAPHGDLGVRRRADPARTPRRRPVVPRSGCPARTCGRSWAPCSPSTSSRRSSERIDGVLLAGVFPEPGPGRPYPWPPV